MIIITHVYMHGGYIYMHYTFMISLTRNNVPVAILFSVVWLFAPIRRKSVIFFVMSGNFSQFLSKETSHQIIHSQLFISFKPHLMFIYIHKCIYTGQYLYRSLSLLIHVLNNLCIIYSVAIRYSDIMYTMTVEYFIHCYIHETMSNIILFTFYLQYY